MKKVYLIAVVFALIAGLATYMFASNINKKTTIKDRETVSVVVALKDIPENTMISEEMLTSDAGYFAVRNIIKEDAIPNHIGKIADLKELVTNIDIYTGEQLSTTRFVSPDDESVGLSFKLSSGKVAYSIQASNTNGVDGFISPGDVVDVLTFETDQTGKVQTKVAYRALHVIRVSNSKENDAAQSKDAKVSEYNSITVEVTEKQALQLYEIENSKTFKLVLNSKRADNQQAQNGQNNQAQTEQQTQQAEPATQA